MTDLSVGWTQTTSEIIKYLEEGYKIAPALEGKKTVLTGVDLSIIDAIIAILARQTRRGNFLVFLPAAQSLSKESSHWLETSHDGKNWAVRYGEMVNEKYDMKLSGNLISCIGFLVRCLCKGNTEFLSPDAKRFLLNAESRAAEFRDDCLSSTVYLHKYRKDEDDNLDEGKDA